MFDPGFVYTNNDVLHPIRVEHSEPPLTDAGCPAKSLTTRRGSGMGLPIAADGRFRSGSLVLVSRLSEQ